jgi:hypothetical protein
MADTDSYVPEASLTALILTLSSSAWVSLGKVTDPVSGEIKIDLKGAKYTIDLLIMLRARTKGNLTADEDKLLGALISDLQANYSEIFFSQKRPEVAEKSPAEEMDASDQKKTEDEGAAHKNEGAEQVSNNGKKSEGAQKKAKETNSEGDKNTK